MIRSIDVMYIDAFFNLQRNNNYTSPHFGNITIGPKKRNIDGNSKYKQEKYIVCGRWNYIKEDIVNFKKIYN